MIQDILYLEMARDMGATMTLTLWEKITFWIAYMACELLESESRKSLSYIIYYKENNIDMHMNHTQIQTCYLKIYVWV